MARERKQRNKNIQKLHTKNGGLLSYRQIQKKYKFKSVKTVYNIVNRD